MLDNPTLEIDREKNEVTIKCNGDTIKFKDDNVEVTRARRSENYKAMNKIRESVFTGSFFTQNSSNMYHNFSTDL
jgi:hypothetical protein